MRKPQYSTILLALSIVLFLCGSAGAQFYFGKNKVQYTDFDWQVMETDHFQIYFYPEEQEVARIAARIAEEWYKELAARFKTEIYKKIPLIIYSSPNYFTQTNTTPSILPESVGGFTEFLKGRVVLPYRGSYNNFRHVIRHELVHVFQLAKLESVMSRQHLMRSAMPPLWFIEGQAEFWSTEWDSDADMVLKDMVLGNRLYSIENLYHISGTYYMYKLGQSICEFISDQYGSDKIVLIYENWWKGDDFSEIAEITLGEPLPEISRKWEYYLKKKYYPEISDRGLAKQESEQLTKKGFSLKGVPIRIKNGDSTRDWIIFKANKMGYSGIYMMPPDGEEKKLQTLVKGERSSRFESLHLLQSGIDANDSGKILFASKSNEADVLYLYDIESREIKKRYEFPGLITIVSPRFSPDGNRVVFSGADKSGVVDLYVASLATGESWRLTDDIYYDIDPAFTPSGDSIVFVSDRCPGGDEGALNLYRIAVSGDGITRLTAGNWQDRSPDATEKGIFFSSDRDGAFNIYCLHADGTLTRETMLLTGAYDPRLSSDGRSFIFTGYQDMGYHIYRTELKDSLILAESNAPVGQTFWKPPELAGESYQSNVKKYNTDYSLDIAQSAISFDPVYGTMGGAQLAMSDMLGDNIFYFLLGNTAETKDEILTSFNVAVSYFNKKNRLNWGLGIYHLYDEYYNDHDGYYFERQVGGLLHLNYPLSKFNRLETTNYLRYSDKELTFFLSRRRAALLSNYVSFISDNSLWDITGPIEGHRYNFTVGITSALDEGRMYSRMWLLDLRHYFRLARFSAFANRLFFYNSTGIEPQRLYFGGSWSFRGYDRRAFYSRNIIFTSNELRFPLIDNLLVGFPFGGIGFSGIRGALFLDAGSFREDRFHFLDQEFFDSLLGSFGFGFRVALARFIVLRFDFTRTTDFEKISDRTDFDFFFGWNF